MSANLKAKLSEDRFEALALRVQWRHKTAAHHSTDQHTCVVSALPSLFPSFTWYLATSFLKAFAYSRSTSPRSFRYLKDKHITKYQLLISTPENHQLCGSGGVMGHHWNQRSALGKKMWNRYSAKATGKYLGSAVPSSSASASVRVITTCKI